MYHRQEKDHHLRVHRTIEHSKTKLQLLPNRCHSNHTKETGSKWSFLFADGMIVNVGDGVKSDGLWYSNSGFRGAVRHGVRGVGRVSPTVSLPSIGELADLWKTNMLAGAGYHEW